MKRRWTEEEIDYLIGYYPKQSAKEIAESLNISINRIYNKAFTLGLKKSDQYIQEEKIRQGERLRIIGVQSRFTKGRIPANKGQKMTVEQYQKCQATMFQKGHDPHNTRYDGHERICKKDGYILIRTMKGKYALKHRLIWEQANGAIPKGMILYFKDNNKQNLSLDNLELITKQENLKRNRTNHFALPANLKNLVKAKNKLTKKIKQYEQNQKN